MRLIDADELREYWLYNGLNERIYDTNDVLESIDEQPDVDPESLRPTAHWINEDSFYKDSIVWHCSACKGKFVLHGGTPENDNYQYCPACGARMVNAND